MGVGRSSVCAANLPSATMTSGRIASICAEEERLALVDLVGLGIAVARRPALHDVGDVDVFAREAHRLDDLREQLPRAADEGSPCTSSSAPGPSPTNISVASGLPDAEDDLRAAAVQLAARAVADIGADRLESECVAGAAGATGATGAPGVAAAATGRTGAPGAPRCTRSRRRTRRCRQRASRECPGRQISA